MQDCAGVQPSPGTGAAGNGNWERFSCKRPVVLPPWGGQTQRWVPGHITCDIQAGLAGQDINRLMVNVMNQC